MVSSSESANRAKVLPVHVRACCSDPGWDLTQAAVLVGSFGDGCRGGMCVSGGGMLVPPEPGSPRVGGSAGTVPLRRGVCFARGSSLNLLLVLRHCQLPPKPFWLRGLLPLQSTAGGRCRRCQELGPPPSSLELGVAESIAAAGGGRSFAASQPRRGRCPSGKAVKGWMLVSPPAGGALPGSHKASGTYGCHTARRSTGSRCCSNAGAGPPPFPLTRFPRG